MGRCVAFGCKEIGVHKFPSDMSLRKKWEKALKIMNFKVSDYSRLCRKHFKEIDYETISKTTGYPLHHKFLKKSVIPTIFSWNAAPVAETSSRTQRLIRRNARRCLLPSTSTKQNESPVSKSSETNHEDYIHEVEVLMEKEVSIEDDSSAISRTQSTQTSTLLRMFSTEELLVDEESVLYYTGLESLCPMANDLKYKGSQVINLGIEDQFLTMLMKLRCNKSDFELSKYFGVCKTVISNIFITWLNFCYDLWSILDIWPERELVDFYMP